MRLSKDLPAPLVGRFPSLPSAFSEFDYSLYVCAYTCLHALCVHVTPAFPTDHELSAIEVCIVSFYIPSTPHRDWYIEVFCDCGENG